MLKIFMNVGIINKTAHLDKITSNTQSVRCFIFNTDTHKKFRPGKETQLQLLQNGTCGDKVTTLLAP